MSEVFISYAQETRALVSPIAEHLAALGVDSWFDREIRAGESFGAVIRARLKEAKAVLVCWSPEAIDSQWVDSEADYAREHGTYVPVFVTSCALMPPFNRIHTDDLSQWKGDADHPTWLNTVERIAKLIGRDGVAAASRALATGDEQARYNFARRYPDEPAAQKIWSAAEAGHRERFRQRVVEATAAAEAKAKVTRAAVDARLKTAAPAFASWLADERRGAATEAMPDPLDFIDRSDELGEQGLRDEIAGLYAELDRAKTTAAEQDNERVRDLEKANAEISRLSGELASSRERKSLEPADRGAQQRLPDAVAGLRDEIAGLRSERERAEKAMEQLGAAKAEIAQLSGALAAASATAPPTPADDGEAQRLRDEIARLRRAEGQFKSREAQLDAARVEAVHFSTEIAALRKRGWVLAAIAGLIAAGVGAGATKGVLSSAMQAEISAKEAAWDQIGKLNSDLASMRDSLAAADKKQSEIQAKADIVAKAVADVDKQRATLMATASPQASPVAETPSAKPQQLTHLPPITSPTKSYAWFILIDNVDLLGSAKDTADRLKVKCNNFGDHLKIIDGYNNNTMFSIVVGPYFNNSDASQDLSSVRQCSGYSGAWVVNIHDQ